MTIQVQLQPERQPDINTDVFNLPFVETRYVDATLASLDGLIAASLVFGGPDTSVLGFKEKVPVCLDVSDITNAEIGESTRFVEIVDGGNGEDLTVRGANSGRLELLARKYAEKTLTPEQSARLSILTERVRAIMPRVKEDDFQSLDLLESLLQKSKSIRDKMIVDLGLKT